MSHINQIARRKIANFQPARLAQARMAKGLSMVDLAHKVGLTRQAISSFEKGETNPSYETLTELARTLEVRESFFSMPIHQAELSKESAINFRTLASSTIRERSQAGIFMQWFAGVVGILQDNYVDFPPIKLPKFEISDFALLTDDDIEYFAEQTRRFYGLGDGPISDLTLLLENNGILIGYLPLPSGMEGLSAWFYGRPIILVNSKAYACRARLDLAHELGHLILHQSLVETDLEQKEVLKMVESQAFKFASAFLVPERSLAAEFYNTDLDALKHLKERWGISIQALIMRLHLIELINDRKKSYLFQKMAALGIRKKEPLDGELVAERPRIMKRIVELLDSTNTLPASDFLLKLNFPEDWLKTLINLPDDFFRPKHQENNVIRLKTRASHNP